MKLKHEIKMKERENIGRKGLLKLKEDLSTWTKKILDSFYQDYLDLCKFDITDVVEQDSLIFYRVHFRHCKRVLLIPVGDVIVLEDEEDTSELTQVPSLHDLLIARDYLIEKVRNHSFATTTYQEASELLKKLEERLDQEIRKLLKD